MTFFFQVVPHSGPLPLWLSASRATSIFHLEHVVPIKQDSATLYRVVITAYSLNSTAHTPAEPPLTVHYIVHV